MNHHSNKQNFLVDIRMGKTADDWFYLTSNKEFKVSRTVPIYFTSKRDAIRKLKKLGKLTKSRECYSNNYMFEPFK